MPLHDTRINSLRALITRFMLAALADSDRWHGIVSTRDPDRQFFNQVEGLSDTVDTEDRITPGPSSLYSIPQFPPQSVEGAGDTPIDDDG